MRLASCLAIALFCLAAASSSLAKEEAQYPFKALEDWIVQEGGYINTRVGLNKNGVRGLLAKTAIKKGEKVIAIPDSAIIRSGRNTSCYMTPILALMKEVIDPNSKFKAYIGTLPEPGQLFNECTMPLELLDLLQAPEREQRVRDIRYTLQSMTGDPEAPMQEDYVENVQPELMQVLKDRQWTLEEVQYYCSQTSSRNFGAPESNPDRFATEMIPILDMANHYQDCPIDLERDDDNNLVVRAWKDFEEGDEVCNYYGDVDAEHGLFIYGFIPEGEEDRLLPVDKDEVKSGNLDGTSQVDAVTAEIQRLMAKVLELTDLSKVPSRDSFEEKIRPAYDLVMQFREKRVAGLRRTIQKLSDLVISLKERKEEL